MTRIERLSVAAAALVAVGVPALLLGFWPEPVAREAVAPPLLSPPAHPPVSAAPARALFGGGALVEAVDPPTDAPDLAGIVGRIGQDAVALVRSGEVTRTVAVGESVDGWTLESLEIDAGVFVRGGQRVRVPLPAGE
ncbi:hypothetical protein [Sphingomonas sp.]|uniref:hypothetical protein n=1 Tax=Sphingomonas sp. TaxID=28214 RepID=UPI002DD6B5B6|nr:hypothetical protein [Sphingomonas sp.]